MSLPWISLESPHPSGLQSRGGFCDMDVRSFAPLKKELIV